MDDYFFNKRDSHGSSRSRIDRESSLDMRILYPNDQALMKRGGEDTDLVTSKALHLSWTKIVSDLPNIRISWEAELTYLQYSISGALRIALLHPAAVSARQPVSTVTATILTIARELAILTQSIHLRNPAARKRFQRGQRALLCNR